jgi:hypothetical protein
MEVLAMKRCFLPVFLAFFLVVAFAFSCLAQTLELGIDRSQLSWQNEAVQERTVRDIHALHATWFRDGPISGSPKAIPGFVNEVKLVKQQNLKMLVTIGQMDEDYDGALEKNRCGWNLKRLSAINLDKYGQRLRTLFGALKDAHLEIDAVEFGNEYDVDCYDGDVPSGHAASPAEIATWLSGYGHFLKTGAEAVHSFFPEAKIITFGITHSSDRWDNPPHHFSKPARIVAMLRNVNGFNYLDNSSYHVDGYGTHIYAQDDIEEVITGYLREDSTYLGKDQPFWVTEWGFANPKGFPNKSGKSMNEALDQSLAIYEKMSREVPLGPLMFYRYDVWLADESGKLLPLSSTLSAWFAKRSPSTNR